jgi:hypothetical protein
LHGTPCCGMVLLACCAIVMRCSCPSFEMLLPETKSSRNLMLQRLPKLPAPLQTCPTPLYACERSHVSDLRHTHRTAASSCSLLCLLALSPLSLAPLALASPHDPSLSSSHLSIYTSSMYACIYALMYTCMHARVCVCVCMPAQNLYSTQTHRHTDTDTP